MPISKDLFLAILSMDVYNRGYNSGINFGSASDAMGTPIGNATIVAQQSDPDAVSAGFYAIAYNTSGVSGFSATEQTIAYRGTDLIGLFGGSDGIGADLWNAYGVGASSPGGEQAELAIKFYQTVAGTPANFSDLHSANISLTGHSSGGNYGDSALN